MQRNASSVRGREQGFSLLELLVVAAIVALMGALGLPAFMAYVRQNRIRGAGQQVAGEIQAARNKAIARNVNYGVVVVVTDATHYRWVIEDVHGAGAGARPTTAALLTNAGFEAQRGPERTLPQGISFGLACPGFVANDSGFRFNRLGGWCDPTGAASGPGACPDLGTGVPLLSNVAAGVTPGTTVCLVQPETGLNRTLTVTPGGRVMVQP